MKTAGWYSIIQVPSIIHLGDTVVRVLLCKLVGYEFESGLFLCLWDVSMMNHYSAMGGGLCDICAGVKNMSGVTYVLPPKLTKYSVSHSSCFSLTTVSSNSRESCYKLFLDDETSLSISGKHCV